MPNGFDAQSKQTKIIFTDKWTQKYCYSRHDQMYCDVLLLLLQFYFQFFFNWPIYPEITLFTIEDQANQEQTGEE